MDFTFWGNSKCLTAIYKEKPPMLGIIEIVKVTVIMGEDVELVLIFDTDENPHSMPQKWSVQQVNTIQFEIDFIGICIMHFNLTSTTRCTFTITQHGDKLFSYFEKSHK